MLVGAIELLVMVETMAAGVEGSLNPNLSTKSKNELSELNGREMFLIASLFLFFAWKLMCPPKALPLPNDILHIKHLWLPRVSV
jgi:hypothetical protein